MVKWTNCQPKTSDSTFICMHLFAREYGNLNWYKLFFEIWMSMCLSTFVMSVQWAHPFRLVDVWKVISVMIKHLIHIWIIEQFILSCVRFKLFIKVIYKLNGFALTWIIPEIHLLNWNSFAQLKLIYLNNTWNSFTQLFPYKNFYFFFLVELQLQYELLITVLLFEMLAIINY